MHKLIVYTIRVFFLFCITVLLSLQLTLPTRAITSKAEEVSRQLSTMMADTTQQATAIDPALCNQIHILIREPWGVPELPSFSKFLLNSGYNSAVKVGPLSSNDLSGYDVVILNIHNNSAITSAELALLQAWVNAGGALLILYEGGMNVDQSIANVFGVSFTDLIVDPTDYWVYDYLVDYQKDNFSDHSIMQKIYRLDVFLGYAVSGPGEPLVTADDDATPAGAILASVLHYGNGRVLFFGDEEIGTLFRGIDKGLFIREALYWLANGASPQNLGANEADEDGDGLSNAAEARDGWHNATGHYYTNPCDADSDDDGLTDAQEKELDSHPHFTVPGYYKYDQHESHDVFQQPTFLAWPIELQEFRPQQWAWELTKVNQFNQRGMLIKGQVWGPEMFWYSDNRDPATHPLPTPQWVNWGGIEIELLTYDLIGVNNGVVQIEPNFHLFIEPNGQDNLPLYKANVEADLDLDVEWTLISDERQLIISDSSTVVAADAKEENTLYGQLAIGDPFGGTWGAGIDGQGGWSVNLSYLTFGVTPNTKNIDLLDTAVFSATGDHGKLDVQKLSLVDLPDSYTSFHLDTTLDLASDSPPPCTEVLEVRLSGKVDWRIDQSWDFTPSQVAKTNHIDEKLYAVVLSDAYNDPNHPLYSTCLNQAVQLLNSSDAMRQVIGETQIEQTVTNANALSQSQTMQSLNSNGSDETFKFVTVTPFDTNGDAQNDAATLAWDADTTGTQADVYVVVEVQNGINSERYLYGPYTITGTNEDIRQLNFYSTANGFQQFTVTLFETNGYAEDGFVNVPTLSAGPGDSGLATLTAITSTVASQTANIAWRATTNVLQENLSAVFIVTSADGTTTLSSSGPITSTSGSEIYGQFVFTAPVSGHYEGKLLLLDSNTKIEEEHFIALPLGVPATTFTNSIADAPFDTNSDGQPDTLQITAQIAFGEAGDYLLHGNLLDSNGRLIDKSYQLVTKAVGTDQVALLFDGLEIYHHGQNGPYRVELYLENGGNTTVATAMPVYMTAAYPLGAFGAPPAIISNSYNSAAVDNNHDGLYEELQVAVQVNVSTPSTYTLSAGLRGPNGDFLAAATASQVLAPGARTIPLIFRGINLYEKQISGPYQLVQLELRNSIGKTIDRESGGYTTAAYPYTQFAPLAAQLSNTYNDFAWDTNSNGLYNYLALGVGVNVTLPGNYQVTGSLADPNGNLVPFASSALYYLEPGNHTIRIPFDGVNIQPLGTTSPFILRSIELTDKDNKVLDKQLGDLYTTAVYQHNQFESGLNTAPLSMLNDNMEGGNANWVAATPWRMIDFGTNTAWSDHPTLPYEDNINASLTSVPVSLENLTTAALSFRTKYVLETNADFGYVEMSNDDGQTWTTIAALTGSSAWHTENIGIAQYSGQPHVQVRFRLVTNAAITAEGWYIDDVKIVESDSLPGPTATPTTPATNTPVATATATDTPIPTNTPVPTDTPVTTPTASPIITPTDTPVATPTATPGGNSATLYVGSDSGGTVGGVSFADEDILAFDTATSSWSLYFDGSDVGITGNIDGFFLESDGSLLITLAGNATLADVGAVTANDIVRFTPTTVGETTAGVFSWVLDGSDVELEAAGENIDGIARTPDGRLLLSTSGSFSVTGLTGDDKDLLAFNATSLGESSAGSWEFYFDGSDVGLTVNGEDIWDLWVDSATGYLYLTTYVNYSIPGPNGTTINGDGDDIFVCVPGTLGENTTCAYSLYWDGDLYGFDEYMDSMSIVLGGAQPTPTPSGATATPLPTATPTLPPTDTPVATSTATPVTTPTDTPVATPTATPGGSSTTIYAGSDGGGTVGGVSFADEDILAFDLATSSWSLFFDGSDVGLTGDIDAFYLESDGTLLLSVDAPATLPDVGSIDRSDIIRFTPTTLGETTAGTFSWVLDGSDVELADAAENIDALSRAPDGRLVISTFGSYAVTGASGPDSDLLIFNATSLGESSAGTWELYFDGSDVGLTTGTEDLWGVWINPTTGSLYLNTYLNFSASSINSLSGDGDDIFICVPSSLGETTTCTFSLFWNGDDHGFNFYLDTMSISGLVSGANNAERAIPVEALTNQLYLPLIVR